MTAGYQTLESFADQKRFQKKMLGSSRLPANYERVSLHAFMAWVHSMSTGRKHRKVASYRTHCNSMSSFAIPERDNEAREEGFIR